MTTLEPRAPYSEEELKRLYPKELELQQVQILLRHGERTPVNARFKNTGLAPYWPYCKVATAMRSAVILADGELDELQWKRRIQTLGKNDTPILNAGSKGDVDAICQPGELTDRGRETTLALGQRIRKLYVDQLAFLPSSLDAASASNIALRATPIPRALESVQQAYIGLYPPAMRAAGLLPPPIVARAMQDETLFPNEGACKRFAELARAFAERTATLYNDGPELAYLNKKIGKWMPESSPVVKVDSHPRLSGIMDTVNATLAHGPDTKLPKEFYDKKVRDDIDKVCVEEWFVGYQESNEYRMLGVGSMIGDLAQRMVEHVQAGTDSSLKPFRMSLSGCHDTTIAGTLTTLGAFDATRDKWPNFTSNIAFELLKRKDTSDSSSTTSGAIWPSRQRTWWFSLFSSPASSKPTHPRNPLSEWSDADKSVLDDYYVRLRYNDKPMAIPFCKPAGRHFEDDETFCTLSAFKEAVDSFTPKDWKAACSSNMGRPPMNGEIDRPPGL
jgi:acid phosphatase